MRRLLLLTLAVVSGWQAAPRVRSPVGPSRTASPLLKLPVSSGVRLTTATGVVAPKFQRPATAPGGVSTILPTGTPQRLTLLTPENGKVWMKLANVYRNQRDYKMGERTLRRAIDACPTNALLRQALADLCRESRRYPEARSHYREAMKLEPALSSVYDSWGRMEAQLGHSAAAAALYERGLKHAPNARLCHALGVLLDRQGAAEKARSVLKRGLRLPNEDRNPQLLHALAMVDVRAGDMGSARKLLSAVLEHHPRFTLAYLSLGQLEERLGNLQAARRHYEAGAITPQPGGNLGAVQLWQSWARIEQRLERPALALATYKRATQLYKDDAQLLVGWAKLEGEHGDVGTSRALFARAVSSVAKHSPYAYQCAAALEVRCGEVEAARALYAAGAAVRVLPQGPTATERMPLLHAWAVLEWRHGERREARRLFDEAEAASDSACGWLLQWRARFESESSLVLARHYYGRAVNAAPMDSSAWSMWAELEAEHGNEERATALSRHAQQVETKALLANALGGGARTRGSPLSAADMYQWANPPSNRQ
jgi:tetratricopeptide (TPR) repeat protein